MRITGVIASGVLIGASVLGCYSPSGASNTLEISEPGACDKLRNCCNSTTEQQQTLCYSAASADEADCTLSLNGMRREGLCQ